MGWGIAISVIGILIFIYIAICKAEAKKEKEEFLKIFCNPDNATPQYEIPEFEAKNSYGYPAFTVTFYSEADYKFSKENGLFDLFLRRFEKIVKTDAPDFDIKRATFFTYHGQ